MVENSPRRVLMKLSGEVFGGGSVGLDPNVVLGIVRQVTTAMNNGAQIAIVVGGGSFFRGVKLPQRGLDRARADHMGILGTVTNVLALQDFLEQAGVHTRAQSVVTMTQATEPCVSLRAIRHLEKGWVVVFGAGAGMLYFSTDTASARRALETHYQRPLVGKDGVDGVYTADPCKSTNVARLGEVSYEQALRDELKVVDAAAFALYKDNDLAIRVFGMGAPGNVTKALSGEDIGTVPYSENGAP